MTTCGSSRDVRGLLDPARALLDDAIFWQYQADGLAVFVAPGVMRTFRVPMRFEELVIVAPRFHLKPLVALLAGDGLFYVLALSQNDVRLFAGTRDTLGEIEVGGPRSLAEALRYDDPERQLQYHTGARAAGDRRSAMFHGHGVGVDDAKVNILRFFQQVGRTSTDPHEIVPAAADGRVESLFVALGTRIWGTFAPDTRIVELREEASGATEDLLNVAALQTILNRGAVYAVPPAEMPAAAALAAVFRF